MDRGIHRWMRGCDRWNGYIDGGRIDRWMDGDGDG